MIHGQTLRGDTPQHVTTMSTPESISTEAMSTVQLDQWIDQRPGGYPRWLALIAAALLIIFLWTMVFPWLSTFPTFAQHIERMEQADIAVDAMFYTELNWEAPDGAAWRK